MSVKIFRNASQEPKRYFGLHMVPGVAEYTDPATGENYRILINSDTIKAMDKTFEGKPIYVHHVDKVDLSNLQLHADGYVVRSFYNALDGNHWVEFLVVSDEGHKAIQKKWRLSNAYIPRSFANGGRWHNVQYAKEVVQGEYEHLAIVPDPRYEESVILTPEEFKLYNSDKEKELKALANSKEEPKMKFWKRQKLENEIDVKNTIVILKNGKEVSIEQLVNEAEQIAAAEAEPQMANGDHHVMVGDEKMTVNELVEKHMAMKSSMAEMDKGPGNDAGAVKAKKEDAIVPAEKAAAGADKTADIGAAQKAEPAQKNEDDKDKKDGKDDKKSNAADLDESHPNYYDSLKNAQDRVRAEKVQTIDLGSDMVARGKSRYGAK